MCTGKVDTDNGRYQDVDPHYTGVKYERDIRLMLGVAAVKMTDGRVVGQRLPALSYTDKNVIPDADMRRKVAACIQDVKRLSRTGRVRGKNL